MIASEVNHQNPKQISIFARCKVCGQGIVVHAGRTGNHQLPDRHYGVRIFEQFPLIRVSPRPPTATTVRNLPENVAASFAEAEKCFVVGHASAATVMYRKAMERSLKHLEPEATGKLVNRIRALAKSQALPDTMVSLLDEVREFGNDGAHEEVDPDPEDVQMARDFTRLFLTYVFELPADIAAAKARRAAV